MNMEKARKRTDHSLKDLVYVSMFTALIAVCSQIYVPTPVPFTLQVPRSLPFSSSFRTSTVQGVAPPLEARSFSTAFRGRFLIFGNVRCAPSVIPASPKPFTPTAICTVCGRLYSIKRRAAVSVRLIPCRYPITKERNHPTNERLRFSYSNDVGRSVICRRSLQRTI